MTEERKDAESNAVPSEPELTSNSSGECDVEPGEVVEEELVEGAPVRRKGIYLLPNALTTASLFSGFYAIVSAAGGVFDNAAIAIFVSMILDGLDGRVARMTNTQSKFGEEYDSLADMVAFGVAPGFVAFFWSLNGLDKIGWAITFIYVAGAALRLARFNTQIGSVDKKFFVGLPSPAAAACVAGLVWCFHTFEPSAWLTFLTIVVVGGAGVLMVSNVLYRSFKDLDMRGRVPFAAILLVVLILVVIALDPATVLFTGFLIYASSGPVRALFRGKPRRRSSKAGK
ncbi:MULTISPECIES: CDP-diacylglycerol--serine O-phosphatidyltransferase [unclassified Marinobacter]|uniref:CDP-diacylglycerol--serine O-phosphatidyltransferase n=1 Tax=unclassified Marinobacter TaxID=83889 RepID=UPI0026E3EB40|nr:MULTISPECIES: CDP-diacylglycerol--serine O-phosphatidyltransferase [unclassified Marinobacter]MDO6443969.1 CDP-diacylglycerol--serine O-phosphatidyltransferase [Marinobacter sp. 2_MG-2023]MDO6825142.1 CDP-diacylglycerol--serine O-phosphatidyltransferase [Marinobacter sp. 1_MG-2023]